MSDDHVPMTLDEVAEAYRAMIFTGEMTGFERVLEGIRRGEIAIEVTEEGMRISIAKAPEVLRELPFFE